MKKQFHSSFSLRTMESQRLFEAAMAGNLSLVEELCRSPNVNINWQDENNRTPLFVASREGRTEVVKFLLGLPGLDHNLTQEQGATPFYVACQNGHLEVVLLLSAEGKVDTNLPTNEGTTPLYISSELNNSRMVSLLLADSRVNVNLQRASGSTPFFMACQKGHLEVVSLFFADPRVDVNKPVNNGSTPFFVVCQKGHSSLVSLFLADERVDINTPENDQTTPLWMASQNGHLHVVQLILAKGREVDTQKKSAFNNRTAAEHARVNGSRVTKPDGENEEDYRRKSANCGHIADLIDEYEKGPASVRRRLLKELHLAESMAGELFALIVYLSDGHLRLPENEDENLLRNLKQVQGLRFFRLAVRLPMDLQMVLCNRVAGLGDSIIKKLHSENGFSKFARMS